jgi:hypothetical protein
MPLVEKQQGSNSTKTLTFVGAVIVGALVFWFMSRPGNIRSKAQLDKVTAKLNQRTPMLIDKETELSNATAEEGLLIYNYRLVNVAAADVQADVLTERVKPSATNHACSTPETRNALLNQGVSLRYRYYDKDKSYIGEFDVQPSDCH